MHFDDAADTRYHVDLVGGETRSRLTPDLRMLISHRPLWDIVVILLSALGIAFSLTGIVIS